MNDINECVHIMYQYIINYISYICIDDYDKLFIYARMYIKSNNV